jgi:hypothetical protein
MDTMSIGTTCSSSKELDHFMTLSADLYAGKYENEVIDFGCSIQNCKTSIWNSKIFLETKTKMEVEPKSDADSYLIYTLWSEKAIYTNNFIGIWQSRQVCCCLLLTC